jgi:hypothetical protein
MGESRGADLCGSFMQIAFLTMALVYPFELQTVYTLRLERPQGSCVDESERHIRTRQKRIPPRLAISLTGSFT